MHTKPHGSHVGPSQLRRIHLTLTIPNIQYIHDASTEHGRSISDITNQALAEYRARNPVEARRVDRR